MRRYLIHSDERGSWDLVFHEDWTVEHRHGNDTHVYTLEEFEKTDDGERLAHSLTIAIARSEPSVP